MTKIRNKNGQFATNEATQAAPWEAKDKEAYSALLKEFPRLMPRKPMLYMAGQGNTKTMEMIKAGLFPRPCAFSPNRWREADIRAWINEQGKEQAA